MSESTNKPDQTRRRFLQGATAAATASAIPGLMLFPTADARSPETAVSNKVRWGMLVDASKCAEGCNACVSACNEEHGLKSHGRPESDAQWIRILHLKDKQTGKQSKLPLMCQHCEHPPCVDVCPTGASFKRADGIVLVDRHICIGCRYCMMACPYKARSFVHETLTDQKPSSPRGKGTVGACNLCVTRLDAGKLPACVEACQEAGEKALLFGDLNDPQSMISKTVTKIATRQIREDLDLNTGVRYHGI